MMPEFHASFWRMIQRKASYLDNSLSTASFLQCVQVMSSSVTMLSVFHLSGNVIV